jgi:GAF domain-containing protein
VKQILHTLSADVADVFGVKGVSIRLLDEEKKSLRLVTSYGLSESYLEKGSLDAEAAVADALNNKPVVLREGADSRTGPYPHELAEEGIAASLTVPINAREGVIGVMGLYSDTPRDFTEDDIILAMALAHQGGLAIQNASMYLKLQEDKKDLEEEIWSHRAWF